MAGVTTRTSTETRKQQIVRATLEAIGEYGVQGATISRIAKGAGITPAALYSHFENRQAILLAALDVVYGQIFESFRSSSSTEPVQRLREICEHHAQMVGNQEKTSHAHLFLEFVASAPEQGLREALREKEHTAAAYVTSIVRELEQQGDLPPGVDPETIAWLIAGWAWTGDVASLMGVTSIWYPAVSSRLLELILGDISTDRETPLPSDETALDGLPDGAVFTPEEAAAILKIPTDTVFQMAQQKQIASLRLGGEMRIPRRALVACLRGMNLDEFDNFLERRRVGGAG